MPVGEAVDLTSFSKFMKVRGLFDEQAKQYATSKFLLENYEKHAAGVKLGGRTMEVPLEIRGSASFGGQLEHEPYSEPDMPGAELGTVPISTLTSSILITLQSHLSSKDNRAAWVGAQMKTMNSAMEMFGMNHSRVLYGDGSGAIAKVAAGGVAAGPPIVITLEPDQGASSSLTFGTKYMIRGLRLSNSTLANKAGTGNLGTADLRVIAVDPVANTITCTGTVGDLAATHLLYIGSRQNSSKGRMPLGLNASIANSGTYLLINRASPGNEWWKATERTAIGAGDLEVEIQASMDAVDVSGGGRADLLLMALGVWRRFAADLRVDRQFISAGESGRYKGGTKMLMYTGTDKDAAIVRDRDVPAGTIWGLDWSTHKMGELHKTAWLDALNNSVFRPIPGTLDYTAIIVWMGQTFCIAPLRNWVMRDVNEL